LNSSAAQRLDPGQMYETMFEEHLKAKRASKSKFLSSAAPFDLERNKAASWNKPDASNNLTDVFERICAEKERPNAEQKIFLVHFVG
jgi:uncharacterized protein YkwD